MSKFTKAFFAFLILIIGILIVIIITPNESHAPSDIAEQQNDGDNLIEEEEEKEPVVAFSTNDADEWEHLERATEGIQALAPGQVINSVLSDPEQEDVSYFTAYVYDEKAKEMLLSIYIYNEEDYSWERLFRSAYEAGGLNVEDDLFPIIQLAGYDDEQLIILAQSTEEKQGPCDDPLLLDEGDTHQSLLSMKIKDPYAGFSTYTPSDDTLAEHTQIQQGCLRDLE